MSEDVFRACIDHVLKTGGSKLVLHHFGEPLMHPDLHQLLLLLREAGLQAQFSTNTVLLDAMWDSLVDSGTRITVMVAMHRWYKKPLDNFLDTVERYRERATGTQITIVPPFNLKNGKYELHRWAEGEDLDWKVNSCPFIKCNLAVVLWDGRIASCCVDHEGETSQFNILDPECFERQTVSWRSCSTCDVGRIMQHEDFSTNLNL